MYMELELGVRYHKLRNAKNCQWPPEERRKAWNGFSPELPEGTNLQYLDF
jgi:hypothetical protein